MDILSYNKIVKVEKDAAEFKTVVFASEAAAAASAAASATSASTAAGHLASIETIYDNFDDRYLGAFASDPTVDNDGNPLIIGAVYFNTTEDNTRFYNGSSWEDPELTSTQAAAASLASETAAAASESAAATSESNAAASETAAALSATNAATSSNEASLSETNALASETAAASSAASAATSATSAATSATAATTQASNASTSASNASTSETNAANSATAAATSATASAASATQSASSETNAAASAAAAATSRTAASLSATDAATSANDADTAATNAATSETNAAASASAASNSAGVAGLNATSSADSASNAANSATAAANSATASATSATQSATSASNAATSESNAAASETAAEAARDAALATEPYLMTEAEFQALAARRREEYAASGFVEYSEQPFSDGSGKYYQVNKGLWTNGAYTFFSNRFGLGGSDNTSRLANTTKPKALVNGILTALSETRQIYNGEYKDTGIRLPPAPTVTHADSTNSGLVKNGDFSLGDNGDWAVTAGASGSSLSIVGGVATVSCPAGTTTYLRMNGVLTVGKKYIVEYSGFSTSGGFYTRISGIDIHQSGASRRLEFVATSVDFAVGQYTASGTSTFSFSNISVIEAASLSRQDLVFLESWDEDISEKGNFVYPYGNVQYRGADVDGLSGIADGSFTGADTYSLFGNWQTAGDLVGKGYDWDSLTDAQKAAFAGNPEHNLRKDGDKIIQTRYRVRVVEGLGDEWGNIDTEVGDFQYSYTNSASAKGKLVSTADLRDKEYGANLYQVDDYGIFKAYGQSGNNDAIDRTTTNVAYKGRCYAMPIALVQRRNQGAFHPLFNPHGCAFSNNTVNVDGSFWFVSQYALPPISTVNAFNYADTRSETGRAQNVLSGSIAQAQSGRPDGKYYDAIYADDIIDLRNSAHDKPKAELLEDIKRSLISGEKRSDFDGDGVWETVGFTGTSAPSIQFMLEDSTSIRLADPFRAKKADGSLVYSVGDTLQVFITNGTDKAYFRGFVKSYDGGNGYILKGNLITDGYSTGLTWITTGTIYISKKSTHKQSGQKLHCDIIGDPANYPQAWKDALANGYTLMGTPLLVGENGEDLIPDGTSKAFKLSQKVKGSIPQCLYSTDNGVSWSVRSDFIDSVGTVRFDSTLNTVIDDTTNAIVAPNAITMVNYTTTDNPTYPAVNSECLEIGDVLGIAKHNVGISTLVKNVIGKVSTSTSFPQVTNTNVINYTFDDADFSGSTPDGGLVSNLPVTHNPVNLLQADVAVKALFTLSQENGRYVCDVKFKEMKWDTGNDAWSDTGSLTAVNGTTMTQYNIYKVTQSGSAMEGRLVYILAPSVQINDWAVLSVIDGKIVTDSGVTYTTMRLWDGNGWGDDNKIDIVDNVTTTTDDNGNTVLIGNKRVKTNCFVKEK
jgi:hypothetical protein